MTEIKTYCDHCGMLLDGMSDYEGTRIEVAHKWLDADLCCECFGKLWDTISEFCEVMKRDKKGDTEVKCKECEYFEPLSEFEGECKNGLYIVSPDGSCGRGKRKGGNE